LIPYVKAKKKHAYENFPLSQLSPPLCYEKKQKHLLELELVMSLSPSQGIGNKPLS